MDLDNEHSEYVSRPAKDKSDATLVSTVRPIATSPSFSDCGDSWPNETFRFTPHIGNLPAQRASTVPRLGFGGQRGKVLDPAALASHKRAQTARSVLGAVLWIPIHILTLFLLTYLGVSAILANGSGFVTAWLVVLVTVDRFLVRHGESWSLHKTGLKYVVGRRKYHSITSAVYLAINELVFAVTLHNQVSLLMSVATGMFCSAVMALGVNRTLAPKEIITGSADAAITERRPDLRLIRAKAQKEGVAFFLPAYNEAQNLKTLVPQLVQYFRILRCPFTIIIVNDGSDTDNTHEVADSMADVYSGYVSAVHHQQNMGYGAALQTGLHASLETGHGLVAFCDADNQFDIESFGTLLAALLDADTDLAIGYRIARADSLKRRVMGSMWHWLSTRMLDFGNVRDVDCGFKIFARKVLVDIVPQLCGEYATISPEILARVTSAEYLLVEAGISHRPRNYGRQTGSDLKVVIKSLIRLFQLRKSLYDEPQDASIFGSPRRHSAAHHRTRDYTAWLVGLAASVLSVGAYAVTSKLHAVILYKDAVSHLEIARRVLDGTSPGLAQLGAVWLPLPHLVMLPLVWDDTFYYDGFAGSLPSMIAFVAVTVLMYRLVRDLTDSRLAGIVSAAVLSLNINMLYMQSTPMTEALLYCLIMAMIFCIQLWASRGRYQYLMLGALFAVLGTLTRYESWPVLVCLIPVVVLIAQRRVAYMASNIRRASILDHSIVYVTMGGLGVAAWLLWNWAIFRNPIYFQDGQFGKPSLWISPSNPVVGNWWLSFKTYWYATTDTVTWPLIVTAAMGLVAFLALEWRRRPNVMHWLPVLSLLAIFPFFVVCLYKGQRPIGVPQVQIEDYNIRFGLMMLMPAAVFIGYIPAVVGRIPRLKPASYLVGASLVILAAVLNWSLISEKAVVTYNEPRAYQLGRGQVDQDAVAAFLKHNYGGGRVLMESYGNEFAAFAIPPDQLVYEGSYRQWLPALQDPADSEIQWIVMSCQPKIPELICSDMSRTKLKPYTLTYRTPDDIYRLYRRRV